MVKLSHVINVVVVLESKMVVLFEIVTFNS